MTRQFDVKDEIELKDDLDKNPNGRLPADAIENYFYHVESFLDDLKALPDKDLLRSLTSPFEVVRTTALPCVKGNRVGSSDGSNKVESELIWPYLSQLANRLSNGYDLGDCLANEKFGDSKATVSGLQLRLDKNELSIQVDVQKSSFHSAGLLSDVLTSELASHDWANESRICQQILANTSFRSENDQVFIVTRLPRAGLDSLLAVDAK